MDNTTNILTADAPPGSLHPMVRRFMDGPNSIGAQECRGDFWIKLEEAQKQAGGGYSVERIADMKLKDIVNVLAQNGIRMTYDERWHINAVA